MQLAKTGDNSSARSLKIIGLLSLVSLAAINWKVARTTERRNPPHGTFIEVDGVKLHYYDRGEGTPIVLIHGNAVDGTDWDISGVAKVLEVAHRVLIFDRPGCGYSDRPYGKIWTAFEQAELLHKALLQLGVTKPLVVGHSFGAIVALAYAIQYESESAALVLLSGYYFWTVRPDAILAVPTALPIVGDILRYTIAPLLSWLQMPFIKRGMFSPAGIPDRFEEEYSPAMALRPSQIKATSVDGALMIPEVIGMRDKYKKLSLPITIMAGEGDKMVFPDNAHKLHEVVSHSNLHIIKGVGHMIHHSATADVVEAIEQSAALG